MKIYSNTIKFFVFCLVVGTMFTSCEEDYFPATQEDDGLFNVEGALPSLLSPAPGFFNLIDLDNAANSLSTAIAGESASTGELFVSYSGAQGSVDAVSLGDVNIPSDINVSLTDVASALGIDIDGVDVGDNFQFILRADTQTGTYSSAPLNLLASCPSALEGEYTVTTTYGFHDFLPDYATNTMDMTITKLDNGNYTTTDFSGGLYGTGPYNEAYNTGPLNEVEFAEVCGNIVWSDQVDPYGPLVMTEDGTNSVNPETGVITISWTAEGYGENAVSVYTPK